jgi:uncharacterized protein YutE (UPF0331/DUF86 family)
MLVRQRLMAEGFDTTNLGADRLLDMARQHGVLTDAQHRSLRGLNVMRNLAVHGRGDDVDVHRVQEFLALTEAMKTVLEITGNRAPPRDPTPA